MAWQRRTTAWCGRVLLFVALLLGIVTMHSLGHPAEHHASHASGTALLTASAWDPHQHAADTAADKRRPDRVNQRADHPAPLGGMDPISVCLAVLGAGVLTLLLGRVLVHRSGHERAAAPTRLPHALRPNPPPRRGALIARLSVLRI
ncbi:DUF6153 family protein [Streptomyces alkaliterrae]|uniref:Uncharacterized protein n=1 Tax=Streptomyces alkaliterrae TaxID=2213162 RepID=A0A5P0YXY8_9ACTN|nr:DUF6153 family protein [Streptomyces alkaliterrae]MBB1252813.1 hypothetical protein [Streptomyces alkaliterrae]MBB1259057.1 hypothetical protein [Streptomyces alkaliterrae]MQS04457.1 hypothetical protein [Streptomyces alkaliterrae]